MKRMRTKKAILAALAAVLTASLLASGVGAADPAEAELEAEKLKELGLFRGVSDTDFDLDREPTRVEALVMLIRALGEESTALGGTYAHPFTDVPDWADAYVGYAYQNGLTNGISATEFGTGNASAAMYVTFMLRALGYSDAAGDFAWDEPFELGRRTGIVTEQVDLNRFLRADVVTVSWAALGAETKDGETTLAGKLAYRGVFPKEKLTEFGIVPKAEDETPSMIDPGPVYILPVEPKEPELRA